MSRYFHFTIGPVQGFVAQARRTRDFWAGSFILSLLAGVAIKAVEEQSTGESKNTILFPEPDEDFMLAITGGGARPQQGSIPNRFTAEVHGEFSGERVVESVRHAWRALAKHVRQRDLADEITGEKLDIWNRQIEGFWEMSWAISENRQDSDLLDRRKNWRDFRAPFEPGTKCMMMDGWQELSGLTAPNADSQRAFWKPLQQRFGLDLRKDEALCAIAFVKRRFARHFADFSTQMPGERWTLKGWRLTRDVPSVTYLAAVPFITRAIHQVPSDKQQRFVDAALKVVGKSEYLTRLDCVDQAFRNVKDGGAKPVYELADLDGNCFFEMMLDNDRIFDSGPAVEDARKALKALTKAAGCEPSPFYAVLLMDGDSLGKQMSDTKKQADITKALAEFTNGVPERVRNHSGFLVYAGGDDVLAVLPVDTALDCAADLHQFYDKCFAGRKSGVVSTLSGAVIFSHIRVPLTRVLRDAHYLLDKIAKDKRGRDAIAVRVRNPGGDNITWALPWTLALNQDNGKVVVQELAHKVRDQGRDGPYAGGFFYRIRERLELLNPRERKVQTVKAAEQEPNILGKKEATKLLAADYLNSGIHEHKVAKPSRQEAEDIVGRLLEQCRIVERRTDEEGRPLPIDNWTDHGRWKADGALLVRFLSRKTVTLPDDKEARHD